MIKNILDDKWLYFRTKSAHILVMTFLVMNLLFFTENGFAQCIEIILIITVFLHDYDEAQLKNLNTVLKNRIEDELTKNREKDKMLVQQSKLAIMGEMLSMIAHQWRQPLNSLGMVIQDYADAYEYDEIDKDYLIKQQRDGMQLVNHLSKTIDDFRDFFKPNKDMKEIYVKDLLFKTISILKSKLNKLNIDVVSTENGCCAYGSSNGIILQKNCQCQEKIYTYDSELLQVFLNIFNNAIDALKEHNQDKKIIEVNGLRDGDFLKITIKDNAGGIPEDIINKIFEPYFSTKSENGTGLGLYMSKIIIDTHLQGELSVMNDDEGAMFIIRLPFNHKELKNESDK